MFRDLEYFHFYKCMENHKIDKKNERILWIIWNYIDKFVIILKRKNYFNIAINDDKNMDNLKYVTKSKN